MRACFVTANFPPEACGGTEQVVAALLRELVDRGAEVTVVSGSDRAREDRDVLRSELKVCAHFFDQLPHCSLARGLCAVYVAAGERYMPLVGADVSAAQREQQAEVAIHGTEGHEHRGLAHRSALEFFGGHLFWPHC